MATAESFDPKLAGLLADLAESIEYSKTLIGQSKELIERAQQYRNPGNPADRDGESAPSPVLRDVCRPLTTSFNEGAGPWTRGLYDVEESSEQVAFSPTPVALTKTAEAMEIDSAIKS